MQAVFISRHGPPEALELRETADPEPTKGQVRVRVRAAGINFADILMRQGLYVGAPLIPFVPGYEVAGEVEKIGPGVTKFRKGDRVYSVVSFGGYAQKVVLLARHALPIPSDRSFEEAAALPVNYLTAYHALYVLGNLRPGLRVLVHGVAGGVGLAAVQLARLRNAEIFGTASASKHVFVKGQGVREAIDSRKEDFEKRVMELTDGQGVHLVLDPVGGSSFPKSYRCLATAGLLVCYGVSASSAGPRRNPLRAVWAYLRSGLFSPLSMMLKNRGVVGFHLGLLGKGRLEGEMAEVHRLWVEGRLRPHVDRTFPADQAAEAQRYLQDRRNIGKILLTFSS